MLLTRSDRLYLPALGAALLLALGRPMTAAAERPGSQAPAPPVQTSASLQQPAEAPEPGTVVSSEVNISRAEGVLLLGFADGRKIEFAIRDGRMFADGRDLGAVPSHGPADRAWRDLLNRAVDTPAPQLPPLLRGWRAPDPDGALKQAILAALAGQGVKAEAVSAPPSAATLGSSDTLAKLESRLEEMQSRLHEIEGEQQDADARAPGHGSWTGPFRYIGRGIAGLIGTLIMYAILVALGFAAIYFGARSHIEAVGDAARRHPGRSWVVGLAASFLVLPAFVLGILALTISIVGIPALLVFVPLFPVAVILAVLLGYLGVAHAAGEVLAERRLYGGDWFSRGNSYYFLLTGLGLLLALFFASYVIEMAGPWLSVIRGLLVFLAVVATWFALTTGLGAVLLTRGGTRPLTGLAPLDLDAPSAFEEEARV